MHTSLPVDHVVLAAAVLLALGVLAAGMAQRVQVPGLLAFLALGMAVGSDGLNWVHVGFDDLGWVQSLCVVALVIILFDGGLSTSSRSFRQGLGPGLALATFGVAAATGIVALVAKAVLDIDGTTALLIGAVVSSTDAAAVFAALRATRLPDRITATLGVESGLNDPTAVLLTLGLLATWHGSPTAGDWVRFGLIQLVGGAVIGAAAGALGAFALNRLQLGGDSLYPVLALAVAGLAYGGSTAIGASGFLAAYVAGLVVGNEVPGHSTVIHSFHAGLGSVAEIGLFLVLGLLVFPARLPHLIGPGLAIAAALVLVARPVGAALTLPWFGFRPREAAMVAWGGLRGAVPIVLATFPLAEGYPEGTLIFEVVFFVVLISTAVQGVTIATAAKRLGLEGPG